MKTTLPLVKALLKLIILLFVFASCITAHSQSNGLVFKNPTLKSGNDLKKGAIYLFKNVANGINATISIDDLVNGASVKKIDDNSGGLGYEEAFQPEVQIGGKGESYALFTIKLVDAVTGGPETLKSVQATSLDIDGTATLKEFSEINMDGGVVTYKGGTLEILLKNLPIIGSLLNKYRADNISGKEKDGIDTTAKGNMYTTTKSDINTFTIKYGATSSSSSNSSRQFSLYMMGFQYPNQTNLPLNLLSFTSFLNKTTVDLKWTTASEKNVSHFSIEKSVDGKNFAEAATVYAVGNTTQDMDYSYTDKIAGSQSNIIFYRLRCIDNDGKFTFSEVRIIRVIEETANAKAVAYPNPFMNELRITIPQTIQSKEAKIELFNSNGQLIKAKNITRTSQTEIIVTSELSRGFYVISITSGTEKIQLKVLKN